jgi:hypothetical protein
MKPLYSVLGLIVLFAVVSAISWETWANPVIDGGREMNAPLRLLRGETLYSQVYYLYGPVAPFFNAFLYRLFGVHLNVLYAAGLAGSLMLILMVFYLARGFMSAYEAMLASSAVVLFSVFKQGGNLIFPYSYAALYGTLLATLALIAQIRHVRSHRAISLFAAGAISGLALCCKFEFGFASIASLIALLLSAPREQRARFALIALGSLAIFPLLIYGLLFAKIPAAFILKDTFILPGYIPAELVYFNRMKLGLNHPGQTLRELLNATAVLGGCGSAALLAGIRMTGESIAYAGANPRLRRIWWVTFSCWGFMLVHLLLFGTHWDLNPLRALPVLFLGLIWSCFRTPDCSEEMKASKRLLLVISVYSLAALARVIIRIPAGGAYGAGLLPVPLLLFVFVTTTGLAAFSTSAAAGRHTRRAVALLLTISLATVLGVISFRQKDYFDYWLHTSRGELRLRPPLGMAMNQALDFIAQNSSPGEYILGLPEGSSLNFLADRPAPLRYEIITPGFLTEAAELESIRKIQEKNVKFVLLFNRPTSEFGPKILGQDYCRTLMGWIGAHYKLAAVFGKRALPEPQIGDTDFFIKCYARNDSR